MSTLSTSSNFRVDNKDLLCYVHAVSTVYPKKNAPGFCFAVLCCGYTLTDFPISIRLTSLALWHSKDCPSASKATLMNMDEYFIWIHYERLHNHNQATHNKTVCIFLGIYCSIPADGLARDFGHAISLWLGVTKPISSVHSLSELFSIIKIHVPYCSLLVAPVK